MAKESPFAGCKPQLAITHEQHLGPQQLFTAAAGLRARMNALMIRPSICARSVVRQSCLFEKMLCVGRAIDPRRFESIASNPAPDSLFR